MSRYFTGIYLDVELENSLIMLKELNDNFQYLYGYTCPFINTDDIKNISDKPIKRIFSESDPYGEENWDK